MLRFTEELGNIPDTGPVSANDINPADCGCKWNMGYGWFATDNYKECVVHEYIPCRGNQLRSWVLKELLNRGNVLSQEDRHSINLTIQAEFSQIRDQFLAIWAKGEWGYTSGGSNVLSVLEAQLIKFYERGYRIVKSFPIPEQPFDLRKYERGQP